MKHWISAHKVLTFLLALVVIMMLLLIVAAEKSRAPAPDQNFLPPVSSETTVEGEIVCLPHKDTGGPQTLECAFGIKLADGTYYGLKDSKDDYSNISALPTGKKARLTGTLKEEPSEIYQSTGTFTVTDSEVID